MVEPEISATPEVIQPPVIKRTTIINNMNVKSNPVTTVLGALFMIVSAGIFILPVFYVEKQPINTGYIIGLFLIGLGLFLCPDDLRGALAGLFKRKSTEL